MFDLPMISNVYSEFQQKISSARADYQRPLTLAEKILIAHVADPSKKTVPKRNETYVFLHPDRVAMQDATAQMALLQFISAGKKKTAVPTTVHCDHLIQAEVGADTDLKNATVTNGEVYDFLQSVSQKYGMGFWKPGAGIIHQVILENYAFPGGLMIGTDSHTPNAGGLGMLAIGVGGADAVEVMAGMPWELRWPGVIGVKLVSELKGWTAPKDVILKLAGILTAKGGTGKIVEYFGEGARSISCTGKGTITNMGAEIGATTSVFPFDERMADYLRITGRSELAELAEKYRAELTADPEVLDDPNQFYDEVIEIDLSELEPHIVGPYTPDLARPISDMAKAVKENNYVDEIGVAMIGSCTNSSYEDIERAAHVAGQAISEGLTARSEFMVTPGSEQIRATIERDGQLEMLSKIGGKVLANACGPCIGQWKRHGVAEGEKNTILTSFNRNFARRNDGNPGTQAFIASPEIVTALALAGKLSFNPLKDPLRTADGTAVYLRPPTGKELPVNGFDVGNFGYVAPMEDDEQQTGDIVIKPGSERLQLLEPFPAWEGHDLEKLVVLLKAKGKCTTDHISPAGPWLRYRGHLENISGNMFIGAENAFTGEIGKGTNIISGETGKDFNVIARDYLSRGMGWVAVGDENYGEGSSREHAAMEPRFLGCRAVITKNFARIHETNLKKQGVLPFTFLDPQDYDKVQEYDRISISGLTELKPGSTPTVHLDHKDGSKDSFKVQHTLSNIQIRWFRQGSALNTIAAQAAAAVD